MASPADQQNPKRSLHHVEEDVEKANANANTDTHHEAPAPTRSDENDIYHDDGAILVDLGAAHKQDQAVALKTAKDGHVCYPFASAL
jgi:hypothetical protein